MIVNVGPLTAFPDGRGIAVCVARHRIAVFRAGAAVFAIEDNCPHRNFPLHDGAFNGETVRCRTHGSCFDLRTGALLRGPAGRNARTYRAAIVDGHIEVDVPE